MVDRKKGRRGVGAEGGIKGGRRGWEPNITFKGMLPLTFFFQ
jgi:hypothetical protein